MHTAAPATGEDRGDGGRVAPGDGLAFAGLRAQAALVRVHRVAEADPRHGLARLDLLPRSTGGVRAWVELHVTERAQLDPRGMGSAAAAVWGGGRRTGAGTRPPAD